MWTQVFCNSGCRQKICLGNAKIENDNVIVSSSKVLNPVAVRYAWADNPDGANLYNEEGLPASPFRTDEWTHGVSGRNEMPFQKTSWISIPITFQHKKTFTIRMIVRRIQRLIFVSIISIPFITLASTSSEYQPCSERPRLLRETGTQRSCIQ